MTENETLEMTPEVENADEFTFAEDSQEFLFNENDNTQAVEIAANEVDIISEQAKDKFASSFPAWNLEPPKVKRK